jgi:D-sedoheptulose 7-phosphate isomerase
MLIDKKIKNGKSIFTFGNGGSAAIAAYFADGLKATLKYSPKYKRNIIDATSFAPDIVNSLDKGLYQNVFTRILKSLGVEDDDILIGISSSGNSENIIHPLIEIPEVNRIGIRL